MTLGESMRLITPKRAERMRPGAGSGPTSSRVSAGATAQYKFLIFGVLLVIMMLFRPEGLIPSARRKAEFEEGGQEAVLYGAQQQ